MDEGRDAVDVLVADRGIDEPSQASGDAVPVRIDRESAVRLALQRNPELRAALASIGFGAADVYEAGRIANPVLSLSSLDSESPGGGRLETWSLVFAFTETLTLPARRRIAAEEFGALQHDVAARAMETAIAAERAWLHYAAALARAALADTVAETGIVSGELAERFRNAGNLTPRVLAEQRAATAMLRADAIAAGADAATLRSALAGVLGIGAGGDWTLDTGLRVPPASPIELEPLLANADTTRLDLLAARQRADALATRAGVENWSRWLAGIQVGAEREREPDGERLEGPTASIPLPVFDTGRGRVARARAALAQQVEAVRRIELDIDNDLRAAHARLTAAHQRAVTYRDALLPARRRAVDEASAQYNFMLIGVFELLEVKRQEIAAWQGYVDAVADFWTAYADVSLAAGRRLPAAETPPLALMPVAAGRDRQHDGHGGHSTHDHGGTPDDGGRDAMRHGHDCGRHARRDDAQREHRPADADAMHDHDEHAEHDSAGEMPAPAHDHGAAR